MDLFRRWESEVVPDIETAIRGMSSTDLNQFAFDLYAEEEFSHPHMDILDLIEEELASRGEPMKLKEGM